MAISKSVEDAPLTPYLKKLTLFASGGTFLDGYILVIIGVALAQLGPELQLDAFWTAMIGVSALVGLFIGTSLFGYVTDILGRQLMFTIDIIAIVIVSIATMFITTPLELVVLRFLIGIVVGADYPIATSLVAEFTPRKYRAMAMGFIAAVWYVGATCADIVGYFLIDVSGGWRWMLGSSAIFALALLVGRIGTPESPRWLVMKGRVDEARDVVKKVFGPDAELDLTEERVEKVRYSRLFTEGYLSRVIFVGTIWMCQVVPMFAIYTFGPQILDGFGLGTGKLAFFGDIAISLFFLAGCIPAMYWLESMGRRPLCIWSFVVMFVSLLLLGIFPAAPLWIIIALFGIYAFFSGGPGILQWLYPNELFPTEIRASAVGAAMALSRVGTVAGIYGLPFLLAKYGIGATMFAGAAVTLLGLIISITMAPETKGQTLAQSSSVKTM
ncbi:MFS transporter [Sporomusa sp.]|uniref:MFS transporter n=1 Tax=Sporomusa sp. TaxID=2078658 RepID=UPI002C1F62F6|nr:MFS transporter [Sporomusa sp.]HWR45855.1 MFS transporter [Sporomusa sp.]